MTEAMSKTYENAVEMKGLWRQDHHDGLARHDGLTFLIRTVGPERDDASVFTDAGHRSSRGYGIANKDGRGKFHGL